MDLYIDTANLDEIKQAAALGVLDGVTTNPSLIAKEKVPYAKRLAEICEVVKGPVSAEVVATDYDGMMSEAEPLRKRIEADPTEPSLYLQLAAAYRKHGQDDRARAALQQGLGPTGNAFQIQLALMDLDLGPGRKNLDHADAKLKAMRDKSRAATDDDTAEDEEPQTEDEIQALRAKLVREINTREIEIFRVKADRYPNDASHRLELGIRLMTADLADQAIPELQQVRKDERLKWKAAMYLGVCFRNLNNWRLAQRNFEEALAAVPEGEETGRKEVLYQLATGSAASGDLPKAIDLGHELANMDYGFKGIGKLLDEWTDRVQNA